MARLATIAALLGVLLVITATASAYRTTTVTMLEVDEAESNQRGVSQRCQEQVRRQDLSHCQRYMQQSSRRILELPGEDNQEQPHLQECCQQMRRVEQPCQCDALRYLVEEQQQQQRREGRHGYQERQQLEQRAREIQQYCRLPERCEIRSIGY